MNHIVTDFLSHIRPGELQSHQRMAVVPLIGPSGGPAYLTLAEAYGQGVITVSEINEHGSVPELRVENVADLPILLLDGEELAGARQNRVLNTTILIQKQSQTVIPVSCTEQGRWAYTSPAFRDSEVVMSPRLRGTKARTVSDSLAHGRQYRADQVAVWNDVEDLHRRAQTLSPTMAMRDVHESRRSSLTEYMDAFPLVEGQTGLLVMIDGEVVGMDVLSRADAFSHLGTKLIQSYAMEALLGTPRSKQKPSIKTAKGFLQTVAALQGRAYKSVGHGQDLRFTGGQALGSALVYRQRVIHAAFFPTVGNPQEDTMRGPSQRRRFRS